METLQRLQILDPGRFYALPQGLQDRHLGHTYNLLAGGYIEPPEKKGNPPAPGGLEHEQAMEHIRRLRGE
jgi:hypothetical protein